MKEKYKSGFATLIGRPNRDHLKQAADHQKPDPDGVYLAGGTDRFCGHAGNP